MTMLPSTQLIQSASDWERKFIVPIDSSGLSGAIAHHAPCRPSSSSCTLNPDWFQENDGTVGYGAAVTNAGPYFRVRGTPSTEMIVTITWSPGGEPIDTSVDAPDLDAYV